MIKPDEMGCALVFRSKLNNNYCCDLISLLRTTKKVMEPLVADESQEAVIALFQINKLICKFNFKLINVISIIKMTVNIFMFQFNLFVKK